MFLSEAEDNSHRRNWQVHVIPCAVGDPMHVEKFFDRNLGDLGYCPCRVGSVSKGESRNAAT